VTAVYSRRAQPGRIGEFADWARGAARYPGNLAATVVHTRIPVSLSVPSGNSSSASSVGSFTARGERRCPGHHLQLDRIRPVVFSPRRRW
jgi:hypothetical protein